MHSGKIFYLLDLYQAQLYHFSESWDLQAPSDEEAMNRLIGIAQARLALLAPNLRIAKLTIKGNPLQRPLWRGTAGTFALPWDELLLRRNGLQTGRTLSGVSREFYSSRMGLSVAGRGALDHLNSRQCSDNFSTPLSWCSQRLPPEATER
ncbi:MAG TPA: hypothetical protein VFE62_13555 [Gemmataceae bacterium]|nr:hypothetical protein [Gemmataceae bacterium]